MSTINFEKSSCAWTVRATEYVRGELADGERRWFERHLSTCVSCREEVEDLKNLTQALLRRGRRTKVDLCPDVSEKVLSGIPEFLRLRSDQ